MTGKSPAIRHTTRPCVALSEGTTKAPDSRHDTTRKALVIKAFFQRNTFGTLPYSKRVGRNSARRGITYHNLTTGAVSAHRVKMGALSCVGAVLLMLAAAGCANAGGPSKAQKEYGARPACAGIVDAKAWTDCMERFKDIRPKHEPTTLQFKDWRT